MLQIHTELEFRVLHEIFCDQYKILRGSFAFDLYVERVYEKFLLDIITIRPIDWFLVCLLTLLNWLRNHLGWKYFRGKCSESDHDCSIYQSLLVFGILGLLE